MYFRTFLEGNFEDWSKLSWSSAETVSVLLRLYSRSTRTWTSSSWKMATGSMRSRMMRTWIWSHPKQSTPPACAARLLPPHLVKSSSTPSPLLKKKTTFTEANNWPEWQQRGKTGNGTKGKQGFINAKISNGDRSSWVDMYSICARSSYGRICASYFCIVDSVKDSTDGRNITSKENMLLLLLLFWLLSHACEYFGLRGPWRIIMRRCERTETEWDDRNWSTKRPEMVKMGLYSASSMGSTSSAGVSLTVDWQEETGSFCVFSFLSALSSCVGLCQKRASKHIQEGSAKPSSCWWDTNSYSISSPDFVFCFF